ncbi:MAG: phosphoglycerate dehydrogenase [Nitrospirota bacterium]
MKQILITTSSFGKHDTSMLDSLKEAGFNITTNPYGRKLTEKEVTELIKEIKPAGVIAGVEPITESVLKQANGLKVISRCGIGMDNVNIAAAKKLHIKVKNTPDGPTRAVAELVIGLMFSAVRKIVEVDSSIRTGNWYRPMGNLLSMQTVGLVGCGRIGTAVARTLRLIGSRVIGSDPCFENHPDIEIVSWDILLEGSDIISIHIPYSNEARYLFDLNTIKKMKNGSIIINTSRGGIVDEKAVFKSIKSGHLGGACLDCYEEEPYTGELKELPQVILTSHIGSYAKEARIEMEKQAVSNILEVLMEE